MRTSPTTVVKWSGSGFEPSVKRNLGSQFISQGFENRWARLDRRFKHYRLMVPTYSGLWGLNPFTIVQIGQYRNYLG